MIERPPLRPAVDALVVDDEATVLADEFTTAVARSGLRLTLGAGLLARALGLVLAFLLFRIPLARRPYQVSCGGAVVRVAVAVVFGVADAVRES